MWVWEGFYLEDPCELTFANTLLLSNAAISLGNAFINLEISSEYIIFFTLWSFFLSSLFISLQIKEFRILALSINDSLYSSLFFFLTGLHFFHLSIGLILLIYFWCSRSSFTSSGWRLVTLTSILPRLRRTKWGETNGRNWEVIRPPCNSSRLVLCLSSSASLGSFGSSFLSQSSRRRPRPARTGRDEWREWQGNERNHIINLLSLHFIYSLITFLFSSLLHLKFIIYIHFQDLEINYRSS